MNISLGKRISFGFVFVIIVMICVAGMAYWNTKAINKKSKQLSRQFIPQIKLFSEIERSSLKNSYEMLCYFLSGDKAYIKRADKHSKQTKAYLRKAKALARRSDQLKGLSNKITIALERVNTSDSLRDRAKKISGSVAKARIKMELAGKTFREICGKYLADQNTKLTKLIKLASNAEIMLPKLRNIAMVKNVLIYGTNLQLESFKSQLLKDPSLLKQAQQKLARAIGILRILKENTKDSDELSLLKKAEISLGKYNLAISSLLKDWEALNNVRDKQINLEKGIISAAKINMIKGIKESQNAASLAERKTETSLIVLAVGVGVAFLISMILAFVLVKSITKPINRAIAVLNEGSEQIAAAAEQVSSSSQSLAEGASEQAAAVEETSSSLEELSSMTKLNAENSNQANQMMNEAGKTVDEANKSMIRLKESMEKINEASMETAKIIKTIDEIAFQTNLLALNAAVEAARAGEVGAGFAVVADEVRNLAMRAAEAAKSTQNIIEQNIQFIKEGHELVMATDEAFFKVKESAQKAAGLVNEISSASREQAEGIEQINQAIVEMDKGTQQVAANAEESASASEELSGQAEFLQNMVRDLMRLVEGSIRQNKKVLSKNNKVHKKILPDKIKLLPRFFEEDKGNKISAKEELLFDKEEAFRDF